MSCGCGMNRQQQIAPWNAAWSNRWQRGAQNQPQFQQFASSAAQASVQRALYHDAQIDEVLCQLHMQPFPPVLEAQQLIPALQMVGRPQLASRMQRTGGYASGPQNYMQYAPRRGGKSAWQAYWRY